MAEGKPLCYDLSVQQYKRNNQTTEWQNVKWVEKITKWSFLLYITGFNLFGERKWVRRDKETYRSSCWGDRDTVEKKHILQRGRSISVPR